MKTIEFTTNHPDSHFGIPALVINGRAFGPADMIETEDVIASEELCQSAAEFVLNMVRQGDANFDPEGADLFCRQWPDGPQV